MLNLNAIRAENMAASDNHENAATLKSDNLDNPDNVEPSPYIRALTGKTPNIYGAEKVVNVVKVITNTPAEVRPFPPAWLQKFSYEELERLAIRTVDGGLSDADALRAEGLTADTPSIPQSKAKFNRTNGNIEWAWWTWNPVTGCKHGCKYCYARDIANRFSGGFEPQFHERRLAAPYNTKRPKEQKTGAGLVFLVSMGDLWGEWVDTEWIKKVMAVCRDTPQWTYLALTKNPERYCEFDIPPNVWTGATADTQKRLDAALDAFAAMTQKTTRFLSCEPLRENLEGDLINVDWIIVGGQSKSTGAPAAQPRREWVDALTQEARRKVVAVYYKPNLTVCSAHLKEYPEI